MNKNPIPIIFKWALNFFSFLNLKYTSIPYFKIKLEWNLDFFVLQFDVSHVSVAFVVRAVKVGDGLNVFNIFLTEMKTPNMQKRGKYSRLFFISLKLQKWLKIRYTYMQIILNRHSSDPKIAKLFRRF